MLRAQTVSPEQLLPSTNVWMEELSSVLRYAPDYRPPLSLTSSLGGAYYLVRHQDTRESYRLFHDRQGRSIPVRMALYTIKLISSGFDLSSLPQKLQTEVLCLLCLVIELAEDELLTTVRPGTDANRLWEKGMPSRISDDRRFALLAVERNNKLSQAHVSMDAEAEDFISSARKIVNDIVSATENWDEGKIVGGSLVGDLISILVEKAKGLTSTALYSAKVLSGILQTLTEAHGLPSSAEDTLTQLDILKAKPETVFSAVAFITGFGETLASSKAVKVFCNRLVSDVAGATPNGSNTLLTMILLNACLSVYDTGELPVESRRQVFAVRQITSWMANAKDMVHDFRLTAEACKALNRLLPNVGSVYGPYWEDAIKFCIVLWDSADSRDIPFILPSLHASLKLSATLESMSGANDDLDDALVAHAEAKSLALIHLLKTCDDTRESSGIVDALLCRRVAKIPLDHIPDSSELYGLLASESKDIQTAAFEILSKAITAAQAQISVDVLLEKRGEKTAVLDNDGGTVLTCCRCKIARRAALTAARCSSI